MILFKTFNKEKAAELKGSCEKGCIGCAGCKKHLGEVINNFLEPMHEHRAKYINDPKLLDEIKKH